MFNRISLGLLFFSSISFAQTTTPLQKSCTVESHPAIMIVAVELNSEDRQVADVKLNTSEGELTETCKVTYSSDTDSTVNCRFGASEMKLWISGETSSLTMSGPDMEGKTTSDTAAMKCTDIPQEEVL